MSPEMFTKKLVNASPGLDVWALGCILYAMLVGKLPFRGDKAADVKSKIVHEQPPLPLSLNLSEEAKHLIRWMLDKNPEERARIFEISDHAWTANRKFTEEEKETIRVKEVEKLRVQAEAREKEREAMLEEKKLVASSKRSSVSPEKARAHKVISKVSDKDKNQEKDSRPRPFNGTK